MKSAQSCLTLRLHGLQPTRLLCPWVLSRQEYRSEQLFPSPGDLTNPGIEPRSPILQEDSLPSEPPGKPREGCYGPFIQCPITVILGRKLCISNDGQLNGKGCKLISKPLPRHTQEKLQICYKSNHRDFSNSCTCTLGTQQIETSHWAFYSPSTCTLGHSCVLK